MTTWRKEIYRELKALEGPDAKLLHCTLSDDGLDEEFDDGYGWPNGKAFTAWSEHFVFFPIVYDGAEWVGYAPRNPCDMEMAHQGG